MNIEKEFKSLIGSSYLKGFEYGLVCTNKNVVKRKAMKCIICYSEELSEASDIEDSDKRFEALNEFFIKIQEIVRRETEIEFLKGWRRFMK